jgi:3-isopropylmalate dehydrogenase
VGPEITGTDKANPLATILSAAMMFRYDLDRPEAADALEAAVNKCLDDGLRTADLATSNTIGCKQMGEEVAKRV